jgi:hypothetical protein
VRLAQSRLRFLTGDIFGTQIDQKHM